MNRWFGGGRLYVMAGQDTYSPFMFHVAFTVFGKRFAFQFRKKHGRDEWEHLMGRDTKRGDTDGSPA